jgi:hypothetical protein
MNQFFARHFQLFLGGAVARKGRSASRYFGKEETLCLYWPIGTVVRGADAGVDGAAVGDEPHWPNERHKRRPAGDAQAALEAH